MNPPERVRSPRDVLGAPLRLERDDAEAAARRVLADYARTQKAPARRGGWASRLVVMLGLALLGAVLGAAVGSLRGLAGPLAAGMALVGALLGAFSTRR